MLIKACTLKSTQSRRSAELPSSPSAHNLFIKKAFQLTMLECFRWKAVSICSADESSHLRLFGFWGFSLPFASLPPTSHFISTAHYETATLLTFHANLFSIKLSVFACAGVCESFFVRRKAPRLHNLLCSNDIWSWLHHYKCCSSWQNLERNIFQSLQWILARKGKKIWFFRAN